MVVHDMLKDLFGLKKEYKPLPLKKKGDVLYEVKWQTTNLEKVGHKVIHEAQNRLGERVIIYRLMHGDGMDDEFIQLGVKVISKDGIKVPDANVHLIVENKQMEISDMKILGDRVNRGYGSIMMEGLMKLVHEMRIKCITGWISRVDWNHIDRSVHFYKKHGFDCQLNYDNKEGSILWVNNELCAKNQTDRASKCHL